MSLSNRLLLVAASAVFATAVYAADLPKDSPFGQAGAANTSAATGEPLEFAGISSVGSKTMVNLYDKEAKHGFWVQEGKTERGVTVVKYDAAHDAITIRRNGAEKVLPLRPPSAVVNAPVAPPISAIPAAPAAGVAPATPTPTSQLSQARQEEEARMLVSDLLEIGMVQRRAYEAAQKKAAAQQAGAANQQPQPTPSTAQPSQPAGATAQPPGATAPQSQTTPSGG